MRTVATCIFCEITAGRAPASLIHGGEHVMAFLDIHPWRRGHALIVPRRHAVRVGELGDGERAALGRATFAVVAAIRASGVPCDDVNVLLNDGPAANQTVGHVHVHVVPRTRGDSLRVIGRVLRHVALPVRRAAPRAELDEIAVRIGTSLEDGDGW
jgi:histidine triad (HIT) family protein